MVASEQQLAGIVSGIAEGLVVYDAEGRIGIFNESAERILGISSGPMGGAPSVDPLWQAIQEDGSPFPREKHPLTVTLRTGEAQSDVIMGVSRPDGSLNWISVRCRPVFEEGKLDAVVVTFLDVTAQRAAEQACELARDRWEAAIESLCDGIWEWNGETERVFYSRRWKEILGFEDGGVGSRLSEWEDRIHPEEKAGTLANFHAHLAGESAGYESEHRLRCKDGSWKWVRARGRVIRRDANGRALRFVGSNTDITERKHVETARSEAEQKYRAIFEGAVEGIYQTSPDGRCLAANAAIARILGYDSCEEAMAAVRDVADQIWLDRNERAKFVELLEQKGVVRGFECRLKRKDGSSVWVTLDGRRVCGPDGKTQWYEGFVQDVTERRRAEEELRMSEEKFERIFRSSPVAMSINDLEDSGRFVDVNQAFEEITGYGRGEVIGRSAEEIGLWAEPADREEAVRQIRQHGRLHNFEHRFRRKNGDIATGLLSVDPIRVGGRGLYVVTTADITENKRAMEAQRAAEAGLKSVIESTDDLIWSVDLNFGLVTFNWALEEDIQRNFGVTVAVGMTPADLLPAARAALWSPMYQRAIEEGSFKAEYSLVDNRILELAFNRIVDDGRNTGVAVFGKDITERKRAEEISRRYECLSRNSRDIFLLVNPKDGRILEVNAAAEKAYGYSADELLRLSVYDLRAEENREWVAAQMARAASGGILFESIHRRKDGSVFPVEVSSQGAVLDSAPVLVSVIRDIGARRRAEEHLRVSEARLKAAERLAQIGSSTWEVETDTTTWSEGMYRIVGRDPGMPPPTRDERSAIYAPESWNRFQQAIQRALESGEPYDLELQVVRPDGSLRWTQARGAAVADSNGRIVRLQGTLQDITERWNAENALREQEEQYRGLFENMHSAFLLCEVVFDADGNPVGHRPLQANPAFEAQTGLKRDALAPTPKVGGFLREEVAERYYQVAMGAEPFQWERFNERLNRYYDVRVFSPRGGQFALLFNDITERKRAEEALRASEARFRALFEQAAVGVALVEASTGQFCEVNPRFCEIAGRSAEELHGLTFLAITHPDDVETDERNFQHHRDGEIFNLRQREKRYLRPDGSLVWVSLGVTPLWKQGETPTYVVSVVQDITGHKQAQRALVKATQQFLAVAKCAPDMIWSLDLAGRFTFVSSAAERLYGWTAEEMLKLTRRETATPEQFEKSGIILGEELNRALSPGYDRNRVMTAETHRVRKDGSTFYAEINCSLLWSEDGKPIGWTGTTRDISERKRAEEEREKLWAQLAQAQKMESVGRLAGGVAHDFNNLLTVINGYSTMAVAGLKAGDPLREQLEEIHKAGERATGLTRQLLAFSRKQILQPRVLDLNAVVTGLQVMLRRLVGEDVEVEVALLPECVTVHADPHQLEQVIINLAVNSRDAMPGGGQLLIETAFAERDESYARSHPDVRPGRYAVLSVSDTGAGMDEDTRQRIFEPFFTTKGVGQGTGLGLSMVQGIVAQSGGHIHVYSEAGQGTTFQIYLPALADATVAPEKPPAIRNLRGKETVLVVEDQAEVRAFATAVLKSYGYRVIAAANAGEALILCEQDNERIHLVLTDVVMPHMSGRDLAGRLAQSRPEIKVLFMSGYTDNVILQHGALEQGGHFLHKPFSPQELAAKVRAVLGAAAASARVLVTDDEAAVRLFLRAVLETEGYEVTEAANGKEALRQALAHAVDLLITDLVMPEQEGIETIQALRRLAPKVGIIAISGAFGGQFLHTAELLGADAVLDKPVSPEMLLTRVSEVLARRR